MTYCTASVAVVLMEIEEEEELCFIVLQQACGSLNWTWVFFLVFHIVDMITIFVSCLCYWFNIFYR